MCSSDLTRRDVEPVEATRVLGLGLGPELDGVTWLLVERPSWLGALWMFLRGGTRARHPRHGWCTALLSIFVWWYRQAAEGRKISHRLVRVART